MPSSACGHGALLILLLTSLTLDSNDGIGKADGKDDLVYEQMSGD